MADDFDPYREALVIESLTVWPDAYREWDRARRGQIETKLHADPQHAAQIDYIRQHTGFRRQITVTDADLQRLGLA